MNEPLYFSDFLQFGFFLIFNFLFEVPEILFFEVLCD